FGAGRGVEPAFGSWQVVDDVLPELLRIREAARRIVTRVREQLVHERSVDLGVGVVPQRALRAALVEAGGFLEISELTEILPAALHDAAQNAECLRVRIERGVGSVQRSEGFIQQLDGCIVPSDRGQLGVLTGEERLLLTEYASRLSVRRRACEVHFLSNALE